VKLLIVGLLPGQAAKVRHECRGLALDLRFFEVDGRSRSNLPASADHCLLLTKFVTHIHTTSALNVYPRSHVHFVKGGLEQLVGVIKGIADGSVVRGARHPKHSQH
jgi:hypothetical protein